MKIKFIYSLIFFILFLFLVMIVDICVNYIKPTIYTSDSELGWKIKKNFNHIFNEKDFYQKEYKSHYKSDKNGLRVFGNKKKDNYKILVVGDSFTMDEYVGNNEMWFSILSNKIKKLIDKDITVYAAGGGGYGTLQELIVLSKIRKDISPDLFILQFCVNDFSDNSLQIEKEVNSFSQYMRRPYYDYQENKIYYDDSLKSKIFRIDFINQSRVINKLLFIFEKFYKINFSKELIDINTSVKESEKITLILLKKISFLFKDTPKYLFNCSDDKTIFNKNWKTIAKESNFKVLNKSSNIIAESIINKKKIFYIDGGHLNLLGNKILGNKIFNEIKDDLLIN